MLRGFLSIMTHSSIINHVLLQASRKTLQYLFIFSKYNDRKNGVFFLKTIVQQNVYRNSHRFSLDDNILINKQ